MCLYFYYTLPDTVFIIMATSIPRLIADDEKRSFLMGFDKGTYLTAILEHSFLGRYTTFVLLKLFFLLVLFTPFFMRIIESQFFFCFLRWQSLKAFNLRFRDSLPQPASTYSKLTVKTLEQSVKNVSS